MQIYELKKGTKHHAKLLNIISNLDRLNCTLQELSDYKNIKPRTKRNISRKYLELKDKYAIDDDVMNAIDELKLLSVFGNKSIFKTDINTFNFYIMTPKLLKRTKDNEDSYKIFDENYIISNITKENFEKLGV